MTRCKLKSVIVPDLAVAAVTAIVAAANVIGVPAPLPPRRLPHHHVHPHHRVRRPPPPRGLALHRPGAHTGTWAITAPGPVGACGAG